MQSINIAVAAMALLLCSTLSAPAQSFQNIPFRNNGQIQDGYISVQAGL
jgi:hypothetical protein